jgi:hypothetical protein
MPSAHHELENEDTTSLSSESRRHDRTRLRVPSRSPHPYHRRKPDEPLSLEPEPHQERDEDSLPTPTQEGEVVKSEGIKRRRPTKQVSLTPSESGTEADDEGYGFIKALPAPPLKPRKGLRDGRPSGFGGDVTPLLTPTTLDEDARRFSFDRPASKKAENDRSSTDEETRTARAKFVKRRRAELHRRISEVALLGFLGLLILWNKSIRAALHSWHRGKNMSSNFALSRYSITMQQNFSHNFQSRHSSTFYTLYVWLHTHGDEQLPEERSHGAFASLLHSTQHHFYTLYFCQLWWHYASHQLCPVSYFQTLFWAFPHFLHN